MDTVEFLANFSNLKVFNSKKDLENYIELKNREHIDVENNLKEIMPDIFGIPIISNKFKEQNFDIILTKITEMKSKSNNFENGYKYKYQTPEIKMYINELSKLILNTSEDCRNEFDEYIQTSINVSRIIADINNKKAIGTINYTYTFALNNTGLQLSTTDPNKELNGNYNKISNYTYRNYYSDYIGDLKYEDSIYNGIFTGEKGTIKLYQSNAKEVVINMKINYLYLIH